eukprot:5416615-Pleurochrysis_carterae.AAC.1
MQRRRRRCAGGGEAWASCFALALVSDARRCIVSRPLAAGVARNSKGTRKSHKHHHHVKRRRKSRCARAASHITSAAARRGMRAYAAGVGRTGVVCRSMNDSAGATVDAIREHTASDSDSDGSGLSLAANVSLNTVPPAVTRSISQEQLNS